MQLTIDALKGAAAWPGPGQRTLVVLAGQLRPPGSTRRAIRPHDCTPGAGLVNGKETQ